MSSEIGWELYRSFLGVLNEGSLSGAAGALGITQPTVGRHVAALERGLGVVLFTRSPRGLLPTEAARSLQPFAQDMASTAAALARAASGRKSGDPSGARSGVSGTVRVTASEVVGVEVLPPIVARLRERHPALRIELSLTNRVQDLLRREADIAVRMSTPRQQQLIARKIGHIELGMFAHRHYLARHGEPASRADLKQHAVIGFDRLTEFTRNFSRTMGFERDSFSIRSDSDLAQLALLRAGAGIGVCQVPIARRDAQLRRVLTRQFTANLETWITMHEDLRHSPECQVTFDALVQGMLQHV